MNLEEDVDRMETEAKTIRKFSDLDRDLELSEEEFRGYDDVVGSSSDESSLKDVPKDDFQALKQSNDALQKKLNALKAQVSGGGKKSAGGKKGMKHVTFAAASGLRSDWKGSRSGNMAPKKRSPVEIASGGLGDSDVEDTNEFAKQAVSSRKAVTEEELAEASKDATRDISRKNELVTIISNQSDSNSESEDDFSPQRQPRTPPKPPAKKVIAKKTRVSVTQTKTKSEPKASLPIPTKAVSSTKTRRLNANNVRITDLPDFMKSKWRKVILPTLYDKFFASKEPFSQFFKGSDTFVALLQATINEVFPATNYKVNSTDALHHLAYNRINERRSHIGLSAIEAVKQHISTLDGEKEAREWIRWAIRGDGPLFFRIPTPPNSPSDRTDPTYKQPEGRLLSRFIINLAAPSLRLKKGSVSENGYPKGLFALIMAALERAVRSFMQPLDEIKEFSNECWGSTVAGYCSSLRAIEEARWKEIFAACCLRGTEDDSEDETNQADLSLLDNNRAFLFDFASPVKLRA
ncbi:hypothetical protein BJ912DRAFT_1044848 [Pholiota molesta]|nr:hypothetical protein BJ912DRAFT_1044848 [Pholiota molesta]